MSTNKQNNISLREVSELAGVTKTTASRILNKNTKFKYAEATIKRVFDIANKHGYRPNQLYRSAYTGKTKSAGIISTAGHFYSQITKGVHDRLLEGGFATVIGINEFHYDNPTDSLEKKIIHRLHEHRVDGFIMRPTLDNATDEHFSEIIEMNVPLITVDREVRSEYADFVGSDNIKGGKLAAAYLAELGHKHIAQFTGDQECSTFRDRASGFETEMIKRDCIVQTVTNKDNNELIEKSKLLFSRTNHPTAVFCTNDLQASIIYDVLRKLNLRIPEDVSVIGFGNEVMSSYLYPKLTTIDQNPWQIGVAAAELFFERLDEPHHEVHSKKTILIDVELLKRESCCSANR